MAGELIRKRPANSVVVRDQVAYGDQAGASHIKVANSVRRPSITWRHVAHPFGRPPWRLIIYLNFPKPTRFRLDVSRRVLAMAGEVFGALAKARPGLSMETKPQSVLLKYDAAPAAEAAILEAAERLASGGGLVLVRHPLAVELAADGNSCLVPAPDVGPSL